MWNKTRTAIALGAVVIVVLCGVITWLATSDSGNGSSGGGSDASSRIQNAYTTCSSASSEVDQLTQLTYSGGALSFQGEPQIVSPMLHCITAALNAPQEFLNRLDQTTTSSGQLTDSFNGITSSWTYVASQYGPAGTLQVQFYPSSQ